MGREGIVWPDVTAIVSWRCSMAVCPSCGAEYPEGVERCRDCDTFLRSEAEPASTEPIHRKRRATFSPVSEAEMIQELLEQNGIETMISGETDPIGVTSGAVPVELLVDEKDYASAHALLAAQRAGGDS